MARNVVIASAADWKDGHIAPVEIEGRRIALCRVGGAFHAFDDHCPHAGSTLGLGTLHGDAVECPRHELLWRVSDGEALVSGEPLNMFRVWVEGDDVVMEMPDRWPEPAHLKRHPRREDLRKRFGYAADDEG